MTTSLRTKLLKTLEELGNQHPNWRFGQLIINVAVWAREHNPVELWDLEDEFLLDAIKTHLQQRKKNDRQAVSKAIPRRAKIS